ncbi:MAG: hypothetical protein WCK09_20925, partial [Bacteroidota bacterium]
KAIRLTLAVILFAGIMYQAQSGYPQSGSLSIFELAGKYQWYGFFESGATIQLKADSTFIYGWQQGLMGGQTKGFWRIEGNKIILNSDKQPGDKSKGNNVEVMNQCTSSNTVIKVRDEDGMSMPFAMCTVVAGNHSYSSVTDSIGIATFQARSVRKISISYVGYKTISFTSREKSNNWFVFTMQMVDEPYKYFTNVKWTVKGNKLYDYSIKTNKYVKTNYYERVETPIRFNTKAVKDTLGADSLVLVYFDEGQLFYQMPYSRGKQNGKSVQYHKNGKLWDTTVWINGKIQDGYHESFNDKGSVYDRGYYKNGKLSGTWEVLKEDGLVWKKRKYNRKGEWVSQEVWSQEKQKFEKTGLY